MPMLMPPTVEWKRAVTVDHHERKDTLTAPRSSLNHAIRFVFVTMSSTSLPTPFRFPSAMRSSGASRRLLLLSLTAACLLTLFFLGALRHSGGSVPSALPMSKSPEAQTKSNVDLTGHVIAPKLGNETAKYGPHRYLIGMRIDGRSGLSWDAQRGRSYTRHLHAFPTIPQRTNRRRSDSTYICFNGCTRAENARNILASCWKSSLPRCPHGPRLRPGAVTSTMR